MTELKRSKQAFETRNKDMQRIQTETFFGKFLTVFKKKKSNLVNKLYKLN